MIGRTISHYTILEKLGEGGMGSVYKAQDTVLDRIVGLKFVTSAAPLQDELKDRLAREAKILATLNHTNICTIFDFCESDGHPCIVMEYIEGCDLIEDKAMPADKVLDIALQIAEALSAAHEKGIIHRDLKAANIMVDKRGRVRVMDFGIAKLSMGSQYTRSGMTLGTAAFMPPEQAQGGEVDHRSDLYSFGVICYQMMTGRLPFYADHQLAVMYAIVNEQPDPPSEINPDIDPAFEALILKAMAKDKENRFANAGEIVSEIKRIIKGESSGQAIKSLEKGKTIRSGLPQRIDLKKTARFLVPGCIILAAAIVYLFLWGPFSQQAGKKRLARQYVEQGRSHISANRPVEAVSALRKALAFDPGLVRIWNLLGTVYINTGKPDSAFTCIQKAIALDSTYAPAYYNLGYALENQRRYDEAVRAYRKAVSHDPDLTLAYSALGNVLIELGRTDEAIPILEHAIERTPDTRLNAIIQRHLGEAYLKHGETTKAIGWLKKSNAEMPDQTETLRLTAEAFEKAGFADSALFCWQRVADLETDPGRKTEAVQQMRRLR